MGLIHMLLYILGGLFILIFSLSFTVGLGATLLGFKVQG